MGWCSGTEIFDVAAEAILDSNKNKQWQKDSLTSIIIVLQGQDWDCECESAYWDHPIVQEIFRELDPELYDD